MNETPKKGAKVANRHYRNHYSEQGAENAVDRK
jgi:hypothetical protein